MINLSEDIIRFSTNVRITSLISFLRKITSLIENNFNIDNQRVIVLCVNIILKDFNIGIEEVNIKNVNKRITKKKKKKIISEINHCIETLNNRYTFT